VVDIPARKIAFRIAIILLGLLPVYALGVAISARLRGPDILEPDIAYIRQLAASGDPGLSEVLDQSMISVPAGEFLMGSESGLDNEKPQRLVYLDAFEIDRFEVTNAQYRRFIIATGRRPPRYWSGVDYPPGQADLPVVGVEWLNAEAYCAWVDKRLPTEAEWEKACRGTDGRTYPWGDTWDMDRANVGLPHSEPRSGLWDRAWILLQEPKQASDLPGLSSVGSYPEGASAYGVMDMAGNASEWVTDWYNWGGYWDLPDRNPVGTEPPWNRCLRGSSWYVPYGDPSQGQFRSRCAARNSSHGADNDARMGFRCARAISDAIP
jgi:formylglycine-generating enzyme required for sulfatase activity